MRRAALALLIALIAMPAAAQTFPPGVTVPVFTASLSSGMTGGGVVTAPQGLFPNGTSGAPSIAFASEPTLGLWRTSAGILGVQASTVALSGGTTQAGATTNASSGTGAEYRWSNGNVTIGVTTSGSATVMNFTRTTGANLKVDALPTIASGFGTGASIVAGSTPFSWGVNVGTGGVATTGVINFNGTAFPSAPNCPAPSTQLTNGVTRIVTSPTQLTLTSTTAWTSGDIVSGVCVSAK